MAAQVKETSNALIALTPGGLLRTLVSSTCCTLCGVHMLMPFWIMPCNYFVCNGCAKVSTEQKCPRMGCNVPWSQHNRRGIQQFGHVLTLVQLMTGHVSPAMAANVVVAGPALIQKLSTPANAAHTNEVLQVVTETVCKNLKQIRSLNPKEDDIVIDRLIAGPTQTALSGALAKDAKLRAAVFDVCAKYNCRVRDIRGALLA